MAEKISRKVKIVTHQNEMQGVAPAAEGFPMREWSIRIYLIGPNGEDLPANVFDKVTYELHPTFGNPTRVLKKPPFLLAEQGWGEFDIPIHLQSLDSRESHTIKHDLNFMKTDYDNIHTVTFKNPGPKLRALLAESGPVPGEENGTAKRDKRKADGDGGAAKKKKNEKFDMEKLAAGLQKLSEDDLLIVVQMVHDGKTETTYVKNDVEAGEFHVDLCTLSDTLIKKLWNFVQDRGVDI
ncbi:SAS complex, SAS5 subunit/transcription initiation factor IID, subunit 14 [Ascodesmis nigricans]|uniref:SAS complex, SAS5 subunit/transcription initiation factor IID, subunit 14 n=1 Tax=Ascodesmis nigricans TaxID=341454 RepID=A0A4S2MVE5_9PEZI|nr:SAS complex, SAS5 subunit/transcription initiation factor IID, subunit 14 [Ascodesmis nigricans]